MLCIKESLKSQLSPPRSRIPAFRSGKFIVSEGSIIATHKCMEFHHGLDGIILERRFVKLKLKRLILQGFKSFKDKTVVHFDDGITGIVGPNGCGKSNIVDALFWVMGEQSAKHLRGKSMKDVIFAGSEKHTQASWAEVSLVLENLGGKHIHIGNTVLSPSEIQLTRKLYKNGETEYRINGTPARLKDIQEIFMDTGAGAKSYSIIAQGEINRLVQAKPEERRVMIEEVAGVTKFKARRRESIKKIENTESNLGRLADLQTEIEKNLRSLKSQSEKAERAKSLKERVRKYDLVVHSHKVFDYLKDFREGKNFIIEKKSEVASWVLKKDQLEVSLQEERIKKEERLKEIEEVQSQYNEKSKELAASEERSKFVERSSVEKSKQIELRSADVVQLSEELTEREARINSLNLELEELESESSETVDFDSIQEKVEILKESLELKKQTIDEKSDTSSELQGNLQSVDQTLYKNSSRVEEYSASLEDTSLEIEELESQYSAVSSDISKERDEVFELNQKVETLKVKVGELKEGISSSKTVKNELESEHRNQSRSLIEKESLLSSLKQINQSLEGATKGTQKFLESGDENYKQLGSIIECEEKYTCAIQKILDRYINSLVCKDSSYSSFASWDKSEKELGVELMIPEAGNTASDEVVERLKVAGFGEVNSVSSFVKVSDPDFAEVVGKILNGYYIVSSIDDSIVFDLPENIGFRGLVSENGRYVLTSQGNARQLLVSGREEGDGVISRNNQISTLEGELHSLKEELEKVNTEFEKSLENHKLSEEQLEICNSEYTEIKAEYAAKKSTLDSKVENLTNGNSRLSILKNRKDEVSRKKLELLEMDEKLQKDSQDLKEKFEILSTELENLEEEYSVGYQTYQDEREVFLEKKAFAQNFEARSKGLKSQIEDVETQIEKTADRIETGKTVMEQTRAEKVELESTLLELKEQNAEVAMTLSLEEKELKIKKDDLAALLSQMLEREDEVKKLAVKSNKFEKEIAQKEVKIEQYIENEAQVVRNVFEKHCIDLRDVLGQFLEFSEEEYVGLADITAMYHQEGEEGPIEIVKQPYLFNRRYGQDLRDCSTKFKNCRNELTRLGEINWQAIEDYRKQKLRSDFLKDQEIELKTSLEDLESAIRHIDEKSRFRFEQAFGEVNERFEKVFPIIFGGGSARLNIVGNVDSPDCGIDIVAQPPGKKMQNINLMSGGEKALTAVSLIFSIFLVKPSPFCLLDEVDAPLDDANVGRFNQLLREMSEESQFILITHNKKTMELNDTLYGVTMQEPGVSSCVSVQLH